MLNARGVGGAPRAGAAPRAPHAATPADVALALASVADRFPGAPLVAVGYSMGGVTLAQYLADADSGAATRAGVRAPRLTAAAVVSSPYCATAAADRLRGKGAAATLYRLHLTLALRRFAGAHAAPLAAAGVDVHALQCATGLDAFIDGLAAALPPSPTAGGTAAATVNSAAAFLASASTADRVPHIRTPTLFLCAADDPLAAPPPRAAVAANPHTVLAVTARGGHLGFLTGATGLGRSWAEDAVTQFLAVFAAGGAGHDWRVVPAAARVSTGTARSRSASPASTSSQPADAAAAAAAVAVHAAAVAVAAATALADGWRALAKLGGGGGGGVDAPASPARRARPAPGGRRPPRVPTSRSLSALGRPESRGRLPGLGSPTLRRPPSPAVAPVA